MATNLHIDVNKLNEWVRLGDFKTKREAVNAGIDEAIKRCARLKLLELAGTMDFRSDCDHKQLRNSKHLRQTAKRARLS